MQRKRENCTLRERKVGLCISKYHHHVLGKENENYVGIGEGGFFIMIGQWSSQLFDWSRVLLFVEAENVWPEKYEQRMMVKAIQKRVYLNQDHNEWQVLSESPEAERDIGCKLDSHYPRRQLEMAARSSHLRRWPTMGKRGSNRDAQEY